MIWPTSQKWSKLDRSMKINSLVVFAIYLLVAFTSFMAPGPKRKDMMNLEWVRAHAELGLSVTKGYNISTKWSLSPTKIFMGDHNVYVSAPPFQPLLSTAFYVAFKNWRAMRLAPILLGLVYLYGCFALAVKYLKGPAGVWLMYFALSPMILIYSTYLGTDASNLGLLLLSYLCITNYLETPRMRWIIWGGVFYLLAFWISYMAFSIVPPIVIQIIWYRDLPWVDRRRALLAWFAVIVVGFAVPIIHLAFLPGALRWAVGRAATRYSTSVGTSEYGSEISPTSFVLRQTVRIITHYTPACLALALVAVAVATRKLLGHEHEVPTVSRKVSPQGLLVQFLAWGVPAGVLAVNHAYIHPFSVYYFALFFAFSSALALEWVTKSVESTKRRRILIVGTLWLFLVMSLTRSMFAIEGGSLENAMANYVPSVVRNAFAVKGQAAGPDIIPPDQW